jgi:Zn-dependent M28 family amino/carboxypeptidase
VAVGLFEELSAKGLPDGAQEQGEKDLLNVESLASNEQNVPGVQASTLNLGLSSQLPNYRIVLALTACEEVGAKGAEYLVRSGLIPPDALVLNVDNVGQGELFYAVGEGMLVYHPYQGALLEAARKTAGAKPLEYKLAYFDTRPFAARGTSCLTLIRLRDGLPPNWHWPSDTPGQVQWEAVEETLGYARSLVRQLT